MRIWFKEHKYHLQSLISLLILPHQWILLPGLWPLTPLAISSSIQYLKACHWNSNVISHVWLAILVHQRRKSNVHHVILLQIWPFFTTKSVGTDVQIILTMMNQLSLVNYATQLVRHVHSIMVMSAQAVMLLQNTSSLMVKHANLIVHSGSTEIWHWLNV